jgi:L-Ala-D/L-Glu epimerase
MPSRELFVQIESFPLARPFAISRGVKTEATVITCTIRQGAHFGRGEAVPYARYKETVEGVALQIEAMIDAVDNGLTRDELLIKMPHGAARNAIDCALWDIEAKISGKSHQMHALNTVYTLSLDTPDMMVEQALLSGFSNFKVKLGGRGDDKRLLALRKALPNASMIIDANEGWTRDNIADNMQMCFETGIALIEQPMPVGHDDILLEMKRLVPLCADESLHTRADLAALKGKYDAVNIKLDKAGGLTEALLLRDEAKLQGYKIMVGCMVASSLSMAPAMLLAQGADFVDLDGPLLLKQDRAEGLIYEGTRVHPPSPRLWG